MRLDDPALDVAAPAARDSQLLEALRQQVAFMRASTAFWRERLDKADFDENRIETLADLARAPILTKEAFRAIGPADLLPGGNRDGIHIGRWTSGTTGRPTVNFWSATDWAALVAATARMLARQAPPVRRPTAFNGYSQAHLTGPLYHAALSRLGVAVFDRSHHPEEQFSTLAQAELFDFDTLVLPGKTTRGKGVGLSDLLEGDSNLLARKGVRWWIGSSGTFDAETVAVALGQGVEVVSNLYGSSEVGPFAISCPAARRDYHVAQGHLLVEVVSPSGASLGHGAFGRVVVTHLAGMDENGRACLHTGSQILRLATGDGATLLTGPCECGLTTLRLRNVRRIQFGVGAS